MNAGIQLPPPADLLGVDAIVDMVRNALMHRPSAFPVPCGALVLPQPEPARVCWAKTHAMYYVYDAKGRQTHIFMRSHECCISPLWCGHESRYDAQGKPWNSEQIYMVDNGFGELVEVLLV